MTAAKRFWTSTTVEDGPEGYVIHLDGRAVKTPEGAKLTILNQPLAQAVREEWDSQVDEINPASMPMFRFTVTAIDRVTPQRDAVIDEISGYGGSDLVCYREADNNVLATRQHEVWQPYLDWFSDSEGVKLAITDGIMPVLQDASALRAMREIVSRYDDFSLAGLHSLVTVSGSLVVGLAIASQHVSPETGGKAALLDDLWQQEKWGYDAEADAHIKDRMKLLSDAARFITMLRNT